MNLTSPESSEWQSFYEASSSHSETKLPKFSEPVRLVADKLCPPPVNICVTRQRLLEYLSISLEQFGATLVTGRAGTGKTALAADFAKRCNRTLAWYNVEAADNDWNVFLNYLVGSLNQHKLNWQERQLNSLIEEMAGAEVAQVTEALAAWMTITASEKPLLIVLDDVHTIFDAAWFNEFFQTFLPFLTPEVQLLLLARSQPPMPLWRMRSKRMLGVLDENLLDFTVDETAELFQTFGLSAKIADSAHQEAYGRAGKLEQLAQLQAMKNTASIV